MISHRTYFDRLCHGGKRAGFVLASFILILAGFFLATGVALAQKTYTVTSLRDDADASRGDGNCQTILLECTLRAAVEESNLQPGVDTILFSSTAPISFTIAISSPFVITDGVTIRGPLSPTLIIDSQRVSRHFTISNPPGAVTLENMTFIRGALCCAGTPLSPNRVNKGSAIYAAGVTINIINSHFVDNENIADHGGALSLNGSSITILNSSFVNNRSDSSGGAIYLELSELAMSNSIVTDNRATGSGGGLFLQSSSATITSSTFARNLTNEDGGAIYVDASQLTLINSTLSGNQASDAGGALYNAAYTTPITYTVSIYNSTIVSNGAGSSGGGVYQDGVAPRSLLALAPSETQLHNSILAGNFLLGSDIVDDCFVHIPLGIVTSLGHNLLTANSAGNCQLNATGDQRIPLVQLYSQMLDLNLQSNGGTPTHALLANSAATDAGDPAGCKAGNDTLILTDQRGAPRKGRCDIGAFETILMSVSVTSQANALGALRTITVTAYQGDAANLEPVADVQVGFIVTGRTSAADKKLSDSHGQAVFQYFSKTPAARQLQSQDATDVIIPWLDIDNDNVHDSGEPQKIISAITPVELLDFSAQPNADGTITIRWQTAIETKHAGFDLYRRSESMPDYSKINLQLIAAQGNGGGASYRFIDHPPAPDLYEYLLEDIDILGNSLQHEPIRGDSRNSSTERPALIFLPSIQR